MMKIETDFIIPVVAQAIVILLKIGNILNVSWKIIFIPSYIIGIELIALFCMYKYYVKRG